MNSLSGKNEIYKYCPYNEYSLQLLINRELWLGPPDKQNDPFEGDFIINNFEQYHNQNFIEKLLRLKRKNYLDDIFFRMDLESASKDFNFFARILYDYVNELIIKQYGISSFSESPDEITMWSHYADSHKGFCIIFDKDKLELDLNYKGLDLKNVKYDNLPEVKIVEDDEEIGIDLNDSFLLSKLRSWSHEKEIRVVKQDDFVFTDSRFVQFSDNSIIGIIFGARTDIKNMKTLIKLTESFPGENFNYFFASKQLYANCIKIEGAEKMIKLLNE